MDRELFIDIETIPAGEYPKIEPPPRPKLWDVKVGNRKAALAEEYRKQQYPILIQKWNELKEQIAIKVDEGYRKQALDSHFNRIVCIGYAFDDDKPDALTGTEEEIIKSFQELIDKKESKKYSVDIIGHNIQEFDLLNIYHKAIKYNLSSLTRFLRGFTDYQGKEHIKDVMKIWGFLNYKYYVAQNVIAEYLGVPYSKDMDGSKVLDAWNDGKHQEIYDYCKKDIETVRGNYRKINI